MKKIILVTISIALLVGVSLLSCTNAGDNQAGQPPQKAEPVSEKYTVRMEPQQIEAGDVIIYHNTVYGFDFILPASWKGYKLITDKWEGMPPGSDKAVETGPILSIRHPLWTAQKPRQDIPIMIFTLAQWEMLQQEKFHIGAAPIGPSELGRNSRYVFALPARYNYAFPAGYKEVEAILKGNALKPTENYSPGNQ